MPLPADLSFGAALPSATFNAVKNAIKTWVESVNAAGYWLSGASGINIAPTTPPGSPAAGDIVIDGDDANKLKYHNGTSWVTVGSGGAAIQRAPAELFTGSATDTFVLASAPIDADHVTVYVQGIRQEPTTDWTLSGSTITTTFTVDAADRVCIEYWISA